MGNVIEMPFTQDGHPIELWQLRVAVYCRVSTDLEEQTSSIELQERYYSQRICMNPNRSTSLNLKERPAFHKMISKCRKKKINLILTKSVSLFGRNTLDMLKSLQALHWLRRRCPL